MCTLIQTKKIASIYSNFTRFNVEHVHNDTAY